MMSKKPINIFKAHLSLKKTYKGGITKAELKGKFDKIYKLSSNENFMGSSPKAIEAIKNSLASLHEYPDRTDARLREALHTFYEEKLSPDHFIGAPSGSEILDLTIRAFLDEGLEVIVSNPFFLPYQMFSKWQNAKIIDIPLVGKEFTLDVPAILEAVTDKTRIIFLGSPNNPTGSYIPKSTLDQLIYALPDHVLVVLDEVYYHFTDASDYTTALPYVLEGKNVLAVNSFSKAFGLASMRIGYAYTTPEISAYIRQVSKPFMINILSMEAAIAALADHDFLNLTTTTIIAERNWLYEQLDKLGVDYWKSQGNFILIRPKMSDTDFTKAMFDKGIMVRPSANFGVPDCVRVTIGDRTANQFYINALTELYKIT